jgi:choline dehydrogenase
MKIPRKGPLAIAINQGGLFTRALPQSQARDIQFHFATLSAEKAAAMILEDQPAV